MDERRSLAAFVGNIDELTSDYELKLFFGKCGESPTIRVQRDIKTGQSLGYAVAEFTNKESFAKALALNSTQFRGRFIKVRAANQPNNQNSDFLSELTMDRQQDDDETDPVKEFVAQLNRRFVPRSIEGTIKRCPECFMHLVNDRLHLGRQFYNCPKCHKLTDLVRTYDEHCILTYCLVCFELFRPSNLIACRGEHLFCVKCMGRWLNHCTIYGTSGKPYLPCPYCELLFLRRDIATRVNGQLLELFEETLDREGVVALCKITEKFWECPKCRFNWVDEKRVVPGGKKRNQHLTINPNAPVRCPQAKCWFSFCPKCSAPWNGKQACRKCLQLAKENEESHWEERRKAILLRHCANCSNTLVNNGGSNYIVCGHCNTSMCFICRESNIDKVEHFCSCFRDLAEPEVHSCKKRCTIFQDHEEYDRQQLQLLEAEKLRPLSLVTIKSDSGNWVANA